MTSTHSAAPVVDPSSAREWLSKLVSFDTTSDKSNVELIRYVAAYAQAALKCEDGAGGGRVLVEYGPEQGGIAYANLVVSLPAFPPATGDGEATAAVYQSGFVLSGHCDCVPVDGQAWDTDPFLLTEKGGRLYGRGTCDMKGFLAAVLSLVPEWAAAMRARKLRKALHLVFTYSEETDMEGCRQLLREDSEAWRRLRDCEGAIIGEPTLMELIIAHKGIHENTVTCRGTAAHSSQQPASFNALAPAARVLTHLFAVRDRFVRAGPFDTHFSVPYTTFCPGKLRGGQALNTTPDLCTLAYQFRNIPEHDPALIEREIGDFIDLENAALQAQVKELNMTLARQHTGADNVDVPEVSASIEMGKLFSSPHFSGNPTATVVQALQQAVRSDSEENAEKGSVGVALQRVSFYTEAGEFQRSGLMTVVCGPGSIDQAHKANEFVAIQQLEKAVRVLRKVVASLCL